MTSQSERYQQLPDAVRDFLFNTDKQDIIEAILVKDGMDPEGVFDLLLLVEQVVLNDILLPELESQVVQVTKLDPEKCKQITRDLIGYRLLPLEKFVPGVVEELKRLGGDPVNYPAERIEKPTVTAEEFLQSVLTALNIQLPDTSLKNRLEFILSSYIHGGRTKEQAVAMMSRSAKVGGIELPEEDGKKLLALVDEKKTEVEIDDELRTSTNMPKQTEMTSPNMGMAVVPSQDKHTSLAQNEQEREQDKQKDQGIKQDKNEKLAQKEQEVLAKKYVALTGKVPTGPLPSMPVPLARVSVAVSKKDELEKMNQQVATVAQAVVRQSAPKPAPVLPKLSPQSLPPIKPGERPDVADVKYTQKLVGPLEELGRMGLRDFHQLASNPQQATFKIKDKIDLLAQESYERKVAGIKAWRESAVNRLYIAMMGEALASGKPIMQVAQEWMTAGKEALTTEEIKAIVQLNTTLKF